MRSPWVVVLWLALASTAVAQAPKKSDAEIQALDAQANDLFQKQNLVGALPLYEELHQQQPSSLIYDERLAMTLMAGADQQSESDSAATRKRAKALLLQAKAGGDNSNLIQILLEQMDDPSRPTKRPAVGGEWMKKAEAAFTAGDLPGALVNYRKALDANPQYYAAALFAGDVEYKMKHPAEAGKWFARAIAINADIETAYRYWGDCLEDAGEHKEAKAKFIDGIIAEPYSRAPRVGLKQWAEANHAMIAAPPIQLPNTVTEGKNGGINITLPSSSKDDPDASLIMSYSLGGASWRGEKFKKTFPNEKTYRHSLAEEVDSVNLMLTIAHEQKKEAAKPSPMLRTLLDLQTDGMLECWILLDNPDQGIAQDYIAFRKDHRDLLHRYIEKYDVHPM